MATDDSLGDYQAQLKQAMEAALRQVKDQQLYIDCKSATAKILQATTNQP